MGLGRDWAIPGFVITPSEPPTWRIDPQDFMQRIQERLTQARVGISDSPDDPMATEALIPFDQDGTEELGVALSNQGYAIYLDPAEPETAAEFAVWYIAQFPETASQVSLFAMDYSTNIELNPETTMAEIVGVLSPG